MCYSDVLALPIFKQEEPQLSPENEMRLPPLQYVLCAATSPAVKLHEETLTYLNQGSGGNRVERRRDALVRKDGRMPKQENHLGLANSSKRVGEVGFRQVWLVLPGRPL